MLLIESLYAGDAPATEKLVLDFDARTKSRLRTRLASGEEAGLFLPRGTILRGGDKLQAQDGRIVEVVSAPEALVEARCASAFELARTAYHLGNRHVAVQVCEGALRIQQDHVLEHMLTGLGAQLTAGLVKSILHPGTLSALLGGLARRPSASAPTTPTSPPPSS